MVANPKIESLIFMFRHYEALAKKCFEIYPDIVDAYFMYDYYIGKAEMYEDILLRVL